MKSEKSLKAYALNLLSKREFSRWELKRRLAQYAESEAILEEVLNDLAKHHWQSDTRFTETLIHHKSKKYGRLRLQQELTAKGISIEEIEPFLPDQHSEIEHALAVFHKKFKQPAQNNTEKQKQIRFLLYRGFTMDTIMNVLDLAHHEQESELN